MELRERDCHFHCSLGRNPEHSLNPEHSRSHQKGLALEVVISERHILSRLCARRCVGTVCVCVLCACVCVCAVCVCVL